MPVTVDLTETLIFNAVRSFLLGVVPSGFEVVKGLVNRVPPPVGPNYAVISPMGPRLRLGTNNETWDHANPAPVSMTFLSEGELTIQCHVFGPSAADNAAIVEATWRSPYGYAQLMGGSSNLMQPLYVEGPKQVPFVNGQQQVEERWVVDLVMQVNQTVTISQDFANALRVNLVDVDAVYAP